MFITRSKSDGNTRRHSCWSDSNSYVDAAEATAIAANLPFYADWLATPQADLDSALIVATRWLETSLRWYAM